MTNNFIQNLYRLIRKLYHNFYSNPLVSRIATNLFHKVYYYSGSRTWVNTYWLGNQLLKCPLDLWIYQEIIYRLRPDVIVETGTYRGGSAYMFASFFDLIGKGRVITIDIDKGDNRPVHDRITYITGSSISNEVIQKVRRMISAEDKIMVVLDSDHSMNHVLQELRIYSEFIQPGGYIIVEDSNKNNHPVGRPLSPGAWDAIQAFLKEDKSFMKDKDCEKFYLTFNPDGYLKKLPSPEHRC